MFRCLAPTFLSLMQLKGFSLRHPVIFSVDAFVEDEKRREIKLQSMSTFVARPAKCVILSFCLILAFEAESLLSLTPSI